MAASVGPGSSRSSAQTIEGAARASAIAGVVLAVVLPVLDGSIVQIALPSIAQALRASRSDAVWVVNAYNVAILVCLLPAAGLADRFGHRRVCQAGVILFCLASAACAASGELSQLVIARAVQGIGAACVMTTTNALIRMAYGRDRLTRAMGTHATAVAVSSALGPTLAAMVLWFAPWPMLFLINLPCGVLALWASSHLPSTQGSAHRYDLTSALLCAALFALLAAAADRSGAGQAALATAGFAMAVPVGGWLYLRSHRAPQPLAPVDLLRAPVFRWSMLSSLCVFAAQSMALIALPFMIQQTGRSPTASGLIITVWPVCVALSALAAGRMGEGRAAPTAMAGGMVLSAGLLSLALAAPAAAIGDLAWRIGLCGLGFGLFQTPNNTLIFGAAPPQRSGAAGGMLALARLSGQTIGAIVLAAMASRLGHRLWPSVMLAAALSAALAVPIGAARLGLRSRPPDPSRCRKAEER